MKKSHLLLVTLNGSRYRRSDKQICGYQSLSAYLFTQTDSSPAASVDPRICRPPLASWFVAHNKHEVYHTECEMLLSTLTRKRNWLLKFIGASYQGGPTLDLQKECNRKPRLFWLYHYSIRNRGTFKVHRQGVLPVFQRIEYCYPGSQ